MNVTRRSYAPHRAPMARVGRTDRTLRDAQRTASAQPLGS
jgi:hypothetical protein